MRITFRETTLEALRVTRMKLGMDPNSVANLKELRLPLEYHPYVSNDGARWSTVELMESRNRALSSIRRKPRPLAKVA